MIVSMNDNMVLGALEAYEVPTKTPLHLALMGCRGRGSGHQGRHAGEHFAAARMTLLNYPSKWFLTS